MKTSRYTYTIATLCIALLVCTGCQSRRMFVNGNSGIMSHDAKKSVKALEVGKSTERDVIEILGQPSVRLDGNDGGTGLGYVCAATVLRRRYLFVRKAVLYTGMDTYTYDCQIWFARDGKLKVIDWPDRGVYKDPDR